VAQHLHYDQLLGERLTGDPAQISSIIDRFRPDVIVNCVGKTGRPNVDWCESHKEETTWANTTLPLIIADVCGKKNIHMIQMGSGCIYFGGSPYRGEISSSKDPGWRETDFANPLSFYSKTKYACDLMLGEMPHVTTLRVRMPVSDQDTPRNLINKLRGYSKIIDIPNSMTFMNDLARCVDWAAHNRPGGIFHVVNPQPTTAARIMKEFQKYVPEHQFEIIGEHELGQLTTAKRSNCILNGDKLRDAGFKMSHTEDTLAVCMASYVKNMRSVNV
jgi:3,5-epimerase/4-reductase